MRLIIFLFILFYAVDASSSEKCPNEDAFLENGWVIHSEENFDKILKEKLNEFTPEVGTDLILDQEAYYLSEFSHDMYLIMWVVIWDRISTVRDEMWGDISFSRTDPITGEYTEIHHQIDGERCSCNAGKLQRPGRKKGNQDEFALPQETADRSPRGAWGLL